MRGLFTAAEIRAAEEPVLASTPEGALMHRAATGLATVCLRLLAKGVLFVSLWGRFCASFKRLLETAGNREYALRGQGGAEPPIPAP